MILDKYFTRPVFWDFCISIIVTLFVFYAIGNNWIKLPKVADTYSLTGDLTNIALTLAGFILTILTVLITFKDNSASRSGNIEESAFGRFFASDFYYETVKHLKNCIKEIITIASIGFFIKLFVPENYRPYFFYYNAFGVMITIFTVWRCLIILSKILVLQRNNNTEE
ncbi:hypothetical protein SAMN05421594_0734 [Chryseobacterium oleae]|uniref:Uncharacterized protein n=1 Tax=Chryseobacterium oleae TaxID=491207 RepID=A0A1I4VY05_CHROL|nr:hypothetical protein [Chryseobacterium oleae]SFN06194.1 hypothetical protein SAMN05421594_0734 [Chryseobacterium oleae]